jgi:hypothetical protein
MHPLPMLLYEQYAAHQVIATVNATQATHCTPLFAAIRLRKVLMPSF